SSAAAAITARSTSGDGEVGTAEAIDNAVRMSLYSPNTPLPAGLLDGDAKTFTASVPATAGIRLGEMAVRGAEGASRGSERAPGA
ncbi:MAG: hypothetical protein SXQ77_05040, partial [Halobacteria archaeon]|nr:hypothetical protein [Halobacteria archaeon]